MPLTRTKEQDAKRKREERAINPRAGDVGPYALGNVSMITNADNRRERVVA
jgi:hypothetical protein